MIVTKLDTPTIRAMEAAINLAIKTVADSYGVAMVVRGGSFGPAQANLKLKIDIVDAAGAAVAAKQMFAAYAGMFGLTVADLGRRFHIKGTEYEITGLNPGAPKFAVQGKRVYDGKQFKFPVSAVKSYTAPLSARRFA